MVLAENLELIAWKGSCVVIVGAAADQENLPTVLSSGSRFHAIDTGKWYMLADGVWYEIGEVEV